MKSNTIDDCFPETVNCKEGSILDANPEYADVVQYDAKLMNTYLIL